VGCGAFADADFGGDSSAAFGGEGGGGGVCEGVGVPFLPPFLDFPSFFFVYYFFCFFCLVLPPFLVLDS